MRNLLSIFLSTIGRRSRPSLLVVVAAFALFGLSCSRNPEAGRLVVRTVPPGADIVWDGQLIGAEATPVTLKDLAPGLHLLTVKKAGYDEIRQTVTVVAGQIAKEDFNLQELKGIVLIQTVPPGVGVKDKEKGLFLGVTPLLLNDVPWGTTVLSLKRDDYDPVDIRIAVDSRIPQLRTVEMNTRLAPLDINSIPEGANVFLEGQLVGTTPCKRQFLEGTYKMRMEKEGFDAVEETVQIVARTEFVKHIQLKESPSSIDIISDPLGASVVLDGKPAGKTPLKLTGLKAGIHTLRLTLRKFSDFEQELVLTPSKEATVNAKLEKNTGVIHLATKPADAEVRIDNRHEGITKAELSADSSQVLIISDIEAGEHTIEIIRPKFSSVQRKESVIKDQITDLGLIILDQLDDTLVVLKSRIRWTGVILNRNSDGSIEFRRRAGKDGYITTTIRADEIEKIESINTP